MPAAKGKKKSLNLCKDVPVGEVLTDLRKGQWVTGKPIGSGGFGFIYLASQKKDESTKATDEASYVVKIEPSGNGPLFCETAFYQRAAKKDKIDEWKKLKKLKDFPVPHYIASGLHKMDGKNLRFLVMPKYGLDLHKLWLQAGKQFHQATVVKVAISLLNALEYMHAKEYVHADIKGANILCGAKDPSQIYLVDYGLSYRYVDNGKHKTGKPDPRKAHNGTIEYTSTDAHNGSNPSRRGDIEILGFVLLHWLAGSLPWENILTKPNQVRDQKNEMLDNVKSSVKRLCPKSTLDEIVLMLEHSRELEYEAEPDYQLLHDSLNKSLKNLKVKANSPIDWTSASDGGKADKGRPLVSKTNEESSDEQVPVPRKKAAKSRAKKEVPIVIDEDDDDDVDYEAKGETSAKKKETAVRKRPARKVNKRVKEVIPEESDDSFVLPEPKQRAAPVVRQGMEMLMTSDTDDCPTPSPQVKRAKRAAPAASARTSSRHSMAPLHTAPVLTKSDKLTGDKTGKHPKFKRKLRRNVVKADAVTQTTPSLKSKKSPR